MTASVGIGSEAPELVPSVRLGPRLRSGARYVHGLYDDETSALYQVGEREAFIIQRLDGQRPAHRIADGYVRRFGKELTPEGWAQIIQLLRDRALLVTNPDGVAETARRRAEIRATNQRLRTGSRTLLVAHWDLAHPHRAIAALAPRVGWLFSTAALMMIAGGAAVILTWLVVSSPSLVVEVPRVWAGTPAAGIIGVVIIWISVAVHELAHGITHVRCGGQVTAVGLKWRFPLLAAFCTTADVKVLATRGQQISVALAGVAGSFMVLLPTALLLLLPEGSFGRGVGVIAISLGSLVTVVNVVPVFALDGYKALSAAAGFWELRRDALLYVRALVTPGVGRQLRARLSRVTTLWCRSYLILLLVLAIAVVATAVTLLSYRFGSMEALIIGGCAAAVLILSGALGNRIVRQRAEEFSWPEHKLPPIRWPGTLPSVPDPDIDHSKERQDD